MQAPGAPTAAGAPASEPLPPPRLPAALEGLQQQRVDVVGIASVEGAEMARYLLAAGFTEVVGHDQQPDPEALTRAHWLAHAGTRAEDRRPRLEAVLGGLARLQLGREYLQGVGEGKVVVPTQGWFLSPANRPLEELRRAGHPFYSMIQAYLDLARGPVVGVTGSLGKSTTTAMTASVLRHSGRFPQVWLAGNDRHNQQALLDVARDERGASCLVLEISNRQLLQMDQAPRLACLTNITPNHLDEHGGLEGYLEAKRRIFDLPGCELAVRNGDDPLSLQLELPEGLDELRFGFGEATLAGLDGAFAEGGSLRARQGGRAETVVEVRDLRLPGRHNLANALAALATTVAALAPDQGWRPGAARALAQFTTLRHRLELVWQAEGVDYYDDLSSTTPQSTVAAVRALGRSCVLICGGDDKGIDFQELAALVEGAVPWVVLLPGAGGERLGAELAAGGKGPAVRPVADLGSAVGLARELAEPGQAILLSPACPGFFSAHYRQGGFRKAVRAATSPRRRRPSG
ncbi:MAG: Mur ligase family protein [Candidatus Dormibacteria bacterium]